MTNSIKSPNPVLQFQALENIAKKSKNTELPHKSFYAFGGRNILFKIEALLRIYKAIDDKDFFEPLYEKVKNAEDQLGKYDFYNWVYNEVKNKKNIPDIFLQHYQKQLEESERELKTFLTDENWLSPQAKIYTKDLLDLQNFDWPTSEVFLKKFAEFLIKQATKLINAFEEGKFDPNEIELGIHELRRKIRWLSIYASVTDGFVQLKPSENQHPELLPYLTQEIINSPYNQLPAKPRGIPAIQIRSHYFYALSWIIEELGTIKDTGLLNLEIENSINEIKSLKSEDVKSIKDQFNIQSSYKKEISTHVKSITNDFFEKNLILQHIISDIEKSKIH